VDKILLVNVFGEDKPGVTNAVAESLTSFGIGVLDIGQAVIHDQLNLGILVCVPAGKLLSDIQNTLTKTLNEISMQVRCIPVSRDSYDNWVVNQGKSRHIITLLARRIEARDLAAVTDVTLKYGLNIDKIIRLSGRVDFSKRDDLSQACVEFSARGMPKNDNDFRKSLLELAGKHDIDIAYQEDNIFRSNRQLVVFDMDSTLINAEVIDELAHEAGVGGEVSKITELTMEGKLDFKQSFTKRVGLLKGLDEEALHRVACRLSLNEGADYLISSLRKLGYRTAIISGGFSFFGRYLQSSLGVDYVYANELDVVDGIVTGKVKGDIIDGERKAEILKEIAKIQNLSLDQVIAVGDGANDLSMLNIAGLGIAFRAKQIVKASAQQSISNAGLDGILYLLGYSDKDISKLHHK
jgi:phosphoserine phosphatase